MFRCLADCRYRVAVLDSLRNSTFSPAVRDLVLIGGGHAHVQVVRRFAMRPEPWLRVTLVARETATPYSGMLPGHVAGYYDAHEMHIDLARLCVRAGVRLVAAEATRIDTDAHRVELDQGPPLRYDVLSLNTGGAPVAPAGAIAVKPIGRFLPAWTRAQASLRDGDRVAVVGAGAGGVELALAMSATLPKSVAISLVTRGREPLTELPQPARERLVDVLRSSRVELVTGFEALTFDRAASQLSASDGRRLAADAAFWVTDVAPPEVLDATNLARNDAGFMAVNAHLQSLSHPDVFGAGDCVALADTPLPKAGVYAVRAGPVLTDNLVSAAAQKPLRRYRPQRKFLTIVGTGDGSAVASRGRWTAQGRWVWRWKDWIDQRFMRKFNNLPAIPLKEPEVPEALVDDAPDAMRCAGCGGKVGADPLARVLHRLDLHDTSERLLLRSDDAAEVRWLGDSVLLTADAFRAMVDDPYRFGRIAAHHALSDIFAMAGRPVAALALASVPAMADALVEDDLYRLLRGALDVFEDHGVELAGGHSMEAPDLSLGFAVVAERSETMLQRKAGLEVGDALVLTKALGTGAMLAAHMRGELSAASFDALLGALDTSNAPAARALAPVATAMTDVTGFGLLGHLVEMTDASGVGARIHVADVPLLPGAQAVFERGTRSSLHKANSAVLARFSDTRSGSSLASVDAIVDPQTAGGLLAAVPTEAIAQLRVLLPDLAVVGEVIDEGLELA